MRNILKTLLVGILFAGVAGIGYTQIDQGELERNLAPVTFYNYAGPHARIETREQIRQIGVGLGRVIFGGTARAGSNNRYFVIHSVTAPEGSKLDADIFGLGPDVGVDHVRNLRTIIQGYLQEAYSYSPGDAALLAEYITIYNAVYRSDWEYFTERYKTPVLQHIDQPRVGLSIRFDEWPGRTLMVIPLGIGDLSAVDTAAVSDGRVIEEMRREDDMGIDQRRDMVDLKEREAEQAEQRAAQQREAAQQEERSIAEERDRLERERQQREAGQAAGTVNQREAARQEAEADRRSADLDRREQELAQQRENAARQEQFAEQKTVEAQQERETIARDQQSVIDRGDQTQGVIGIVLGQASATMGRLVSLDPATKRELRRSPLDMVYVRTLTFVGNKVLAIAGENRGNGAVRLIEISRSSLEMSQQGDDDIHPGSLIWVNGNDLYAITANLSNNTLNLARFNNNLALQAKSAITVHPNATVSIQQGQLVTQRTDGSVAVLNPADLTER